MLTGLTRGLLHPWDVPKSWQTASRRRLPTVSLLESVCICSHLSNGSARYGIMERAFANSREALPICV